MNANRSFQFSHALCRRPSKSIVNGLRATDHGDPDYTTFVQQHAHYVKALQQAGCEVNVLDANEDHPDSVFIEDAALCLENMAIVLRPGAESRFGEAAVLMPTLHRLFKHVITLPGHGYVDGGDILVTGTEILIGLSQRTNRAGYESLRQLLEPFDYNVREIQTPDTILHFKSDCGLLNSNTVFSTKALAATGCFDNYNVIEAPENESAAANLIRVNNTVLLSEGYPASFDLLTSVGFQVVTIPNSEAAKVDGGLSCMSLRYTT